jgi:hypothetical protein
MASDRTTDATTGEPEKCPRCETVLRIGDMAFTKHDAEFCAAATYNLLKVTREAMKAQEETMIQSARGTIDATREREKRDVVLWLRKQAPLTCSWGATHYRQAANRIESDAHRPSRCGYCDTPATHRHAEGSLRCEEHTPRDPETPWRPDDGWTRIESGALGPHLGRCPQCGGPADNGHDRSVPPTPYLCTRCERLLDFRRPR